MTLYIAREEGGGRRDWLDAKISLPLGIRRQERPPSAQLPWWNVLGAEGAWNPNNASKAIFLVHMTTDASGSISARAIFLARLCLMVTDLPTSQVSSYVLQTTKFCIQYNSQVLKSPRSILNHAISYVATHILLSPLPRHAVAGNSRNGRRRHRSRRQNQDDRERDHDYDHDSASHSHAADRCGKVALPGK